MDHAMLATPDHDDQARLQYIVTLKRDLLSIVHGSRGAAEGRAGDAYEARTGKRPERWTEIGEALAGDPFYQLWSSVSRSAQDLMWAATKRTVDRSLPRLKETAARLGNRPAGGSLTIPEGFQPPADAFAAYIHGQPGGYLRADEEGGFVAGAIYEAGGRTYSSGHRRAAGGSSVTPVATVVKARYPDFAPRTALDMGCSAGSSTLGVRESWPSIERLDAIDVGAGLITYAHYRAESLGVPVHFHQMDAGRLAFPDDSFDLVYAGLLLHEASPAKNQDIMREARRVLKPGGLLIFQDVPIRTQDYDAFERFNSGWQTDNNDEPFWNAYIDSDYRAMMAAAGFAAPHIHEDAAPMIETNRAWYVLIGEKPDAAGRVATAR